MADILADYITRKDLAAQLGRSVRSLERWEEERTGPDVTRVGRSVLYRVDSVRDWLRSREQPMIANKRRGRR